MNIIKTIDNLYKDWRGYSHVYDANQEIFGSEEMQDFARYCVESKSYFTFIFAIHRDDWKFFRYGLFELDGQEITRAVSDKDFFNRIQVERVGEIVPENFRACKITFQDSNDLILFIEKIQKNNITLFSLQNFDNV